MNANKSANKIGALALSVFCLMTSAPQPLSAAAAPAAPPANAPAAPGTPAKSPTKSNPPFVGVVQKVDITASTITLNGKEGGRVFVVTPETRITKNGQPAKLTDAKLGEEAAGTFKDEGTKRLAVSLRLGPKPGKTSAPAKK
jgi:hypothetical protein